MAARCAKFDRADVIAHDVRRGYSRDISRLSTAGVANFMPGKARFEAKAALNHSNKSLDVTRKYIGADDNKKLILNRLDPLAPQSIADAVDTEVIAAESNEAAEDFLDCIRPLRPLDQLEAFDVDEDEMSALLERATGADAEYAESVAALGPCELLGWAFVEHFSGCRESTLATADIKQRVQCSRCEAWLEKR